MDARVSDFGLAVCGGDREVDWSSVMPAGTIGYIDPCYTESGKLGPQSDVYSFGVLLLEIMSSRKVFDLDSDPSSIVSWATPLIKQLKHGEVCDKRLLPLLNNTERIRISVKRILNAAVQCLSEDVKKRPSMRDLADELQDIAESINKWPVNRALKVKPFGGKVSCCVHRCVRAWKRCVKKRVTTTTTTRIVCKDHLVILGGGDDDHES